MQADTVSLTIASIKIFDGTASNSHHELTVSPFDQLHFEIVQAFIGNGIFAKQSHPVAIGLVTIDLPLDQYIIPGGQRLIGLKLQLGKPSNSRVLIPPTNLLHNPLQPLKLIHLYLLQADHKIFLDFSIARLVNHNREFQGTGVGGHDVLLALDLVFDDGVDVGDIPEELLDGFVQGLVREVGAVDTAVKVRHDLQFQLRAGNQGARHLEVAQVGGELASFGLHRIMGIQYYDYGKRLGYKRGQHNKDWLFI